MNRSLILLNNSELVKISQEQRGSNFPTTPPWCLAIDAGHTESLREACWQNPYATAIQMAHPRQKLPGFLPAAYQAGTQFIKDIL